MLRQKGELAAILRRLGVGKWSAERCGRVAGGTRASQQSARRVEDGGRELLVLRLLGGPAPRLVELVADLECEDARRTLSHDIGRLRCGGSHVAQSIVDAIDNLCSRRGQKAAELVDTAGRDVTLSNPSP